MEIFRSVWRIYQYENKHLFLVKGYLIMEEKVLTVIDETEILGKRIQMYGSEDNPLFLAKELGIGEYKLFSFLRGKKVFFYNKDMVNIPYERFRKEGKFVVKETQCHDGNYRAVTYVTKKGLAYIQKLLRKNGYYENTITV